jgi:hypothetical protein
MVPSHKAVTRYAAACLRLDLVCVFATSCAGGEYAAAAAPIRSRISTKSILVSTHERIVSSIKLGSSSSPQMDFHRLKRSSIYHPEYNYRRKLDPRGLLADTRTRGPVATRRLDKETE